MTLRAGHLPAGFPSQVANAIFERVSSRAGSWQLAVGSWQLAVGSRQWKIEVLGKKVLREAGGASLGPFVN